jgi:AcrR family transcriptional regulator
MARKPPRSTGGASRDAAEPQPAGSDKSDRDRVIDAFMALLAEKPIEQIGFAEIAARAGVSLAELRNLFGSTLAILAAHVKETDRAVLAGSDADMAEEPPRERSSARPAAIPVSASRSTA